MRTMILSGMAATAMALGGCSNGTSDADRGPTDRPAGNTSGNPGMDVPSQSGRPGATDGGMRSNGESIGAGGSTSGTGAGK